MSIRTYHKTPTNRGTNWNKLKQEIKFEICSGPAESLWLRLEKVIEKYKGSGRGVHVGIRDK